MVQTGALRLYFFPTQTAPVPPLPRLDAVLYGGRGDPMTDTLPIRPTPGLLVSVRHSDEVDIAINGGARLIDVKEPTRGALGRAENAVVADVVTKVAGRRPISAALGELSDGPPDLPGELDS